MKSTQLVPPLRESTLRTKHTKESPANGGTLGVLSFVDLVKLSHRVLRVNKKTAGYGAGSVVWSMPTHQSRYKSKKY